MDPMDIHTTLERQLFLKAEEKHIPLYGVLELIPLCNLNCDMCYVRLSREEMLSQGSLHSADDWLSLIDSMKVAGTLFILLTGGEPLLHPDFKKIYLSLQKAGMIVTINTNGTLLNEDWAKFFSKNKPRRINITLYGSNNQTYNELCHLSDGFDKAIHGIELLRQHQIDVKINGSLTRKNFNDRLDLIDLGESLGIPVRIDTYMYPSIRERSKPFDSQVRLSPDMAAFAKIEVFRREMGATTFQEYMERTLFLATNTPEGKHTPGHMSCRAGQSSFVINWQGMMRSCVVLDNPSIPVFNTDHDFQSSWEQIVKETSAIKTSPVCNSCTLRAVCNNCAASAMAECGSYDSVPEYLCEYTRSIIKYLQEIYDSTASNT